MCVLVADQCIDYVGDNAAGTHGIIDDGLGGVLDSGHVFIVMMNAQLGNQAV